MYNDEESKKLKKYMTDTLTNINSQLKKFMLKYEKNPKLQSEIDSLIYQHPIFDNKKTIQKFNTLLKFSGEEEKAKLEENKQKSRMYRERQKELNKVKDFVNQNYLKMLPEGNNIIKQIEPSKEEKKDNEKEEKKEEKNEKKNSNLIADFTIKEEEKTKNKNNNNENSEEKNEIKIEEIPSNDYLLKKRSKKKKKK